MVNKLTLCVITPTKVVYQEEVRFAVLRSSDGEIGFFPGHEPTILSLDFGDIRIFGEDESKQTDTLTVLGGFATINETSITVLSDFAEHPDNIDKARLEKMRTRAESRLRERNSDTNIQRAEVALRRSLLRGNKGASVLLEDEWKD